MALKFTGSAQGQTRGQTNKPNKREKKKIPGEEKISWGEKVPRKKFTWEKKKNYFT